MGEKAQQRVAVMHEVAQGAGVATDAAALLGVSERQVWRRLCQESDGGVAR